MKFSTTQKTKITHMITKGEKMDEIAKQIGGTCNWLDIRKRPTNPSGSGDYFSL